MKHKAIALALACLLLFAFAGCVKKTSPPGPEPGTPGTLTVSFDFERQSGSGSNQFAVWIEDMEGNLLKTLAATKFTARGGYERRPDSLAVWVERAMGVSDFDAVAAATPKSGPVAYVLDCADLPAGTYRFLVEGTLRMKSYVLYTGEIDVGSLDASAKAIPAFFPAEDAPEQGMIVNVKADYVA